MDQPLISVDEENPAAPGSQPCFCGIEWQQSELLANCFVSADETAVLLVFQASAIISCMVAIFV